MERSVMLVKITKDRGQEKWYKLGQIYLVFSFPKKYHDGAGYQVVGYTCGISLKDCEYLNDDPLKYVMDYNPEDGLIPSDELLRGWTDNRFSYKNNNIIKNE